MRLAEKHVVSSDQPRVCVADGAGWPCDTRLALDLVDALLPDRALPPPAAPGLREAIAAVEVALAALAALAETPGEPHD